MIKTYDLIPERLDTCFSEVWFSHIFLNLLCSSCSLVVIEVYALRGHYLAHMQSILESLFSLLMLIFIAFLKDLK